MKKMSILFFIVLLMVGCSKAPEKEKVALRIGDIEITAREFNAAFNAAGTTVNGPVGRQRFLQTYISRKLILKEAEKMGLSKDPMFLESVQIFWEQALLKLMLEKKSQEIVTTINIGDDLITEYYQKNKDKLYADKDLPEVYKQIKWMLLKQKQSQAIQEWVASLEKKVVVDVVDKELLGLTSTKK